MKFVVMALTNGTDLQAIIDALKSKILINCELITVISNKECFAIERAKNQGFDTRIVKFKKEDSRESYDRRVSEIIENQGAEFIVLVGYMRLFSEWFVKKYENKIINVHPSLLPAFPGMDLSVHEEVLKYGCKVTGCTFHFVNKEMDAGPIIGQFVTKIDSNEDIHSLKSKVQELEKKYYPKIIQSYVDGKITVKNRKVTIN